MANDIIIKDFNARIADGGRVYLHEVLKELGFETFRMEHYNSFWDANGFHESESYILVDEKELIDILESMYQEGLNMYHKL